MGARKKGKSTWIPRSASGAHRSSGGTKVMGQDRPSVPGPQGRCSGGTFTGKVGRMLRAIRVLSRSPRVEEAVGEITTGASDLGCAHGEQKMVILFAGEQYASALDGFGRALMDRAGVDSVVGCSTAGVYPLEAKGSDPGVSALVVAGDFEAEAFLLRDLRGRAESVGREVGRRVAASSHEPSAVLLFADSYNFAPDEVLGGIAEVAPGMPVVGAGATESGASGTTIVLGQNASSDNAVAGLILGGLDVSPVPIPLLSPLAPYWRIDRAEANRVLQLDGAPALERFLQALPASWRDDPETAVESVHVVLAAREGEAPGLLRPLVGIDPDQGSILVGDEVLAGMRLSLSVGDPVRARQEFENRLDQLNRGRRPSVALYIGCDLSPERAFGAAGIDDAYLGRALGTTPWAGFQGHVTLAPHAGRNRFHQFTPIVVGLAPRADMR